TPADDLRGRAEHADRPGPHRRPALVAVRADAGQELAAVADFAQKGVEPARVTLPRVALERGDEPLGEGLARPRVAGDDRLGDGDAHLRVVGVAARPDGVLGMPDVAGQVVVPGDDVAGAYSNP